MVSDDFKKELKNKGYKITITSDRESVVFEKNQKVDTIKVSTIRKIFLNSIISYLDNIKEE